MKVLIIEDETAFRQVLVSQMEKDGIEAIGVGTGTEGINEIANNDFDVIITDLRLPDIEGLEIIQQVRESGNTTPIILMTAFASVKTAVSALKMGAQDYVIKPLRVPDLIRRAQQLYDIDRLKTENTFLRRIVQHVNSEFWFSDTPSGEKIKNLITKVSSKNLTVLITGESGVGKGVVARMIHMASDRSNAPFIRVNCGAIPENLLESELFGHVKGAFTGADRAQDGLFVAASKGILFLDEIGEMPLSAQVKLLHVLEEKTVRAVGAKKDRKIDTRFVIATNQNLEEMVSKGAFRSDLYYRLNVVQITVPPLRDQKEAIKSAIEFIIEKYTNRYNLDSITIDPEVWDALQAHTWPGNFRELDNALQRALLLCDDDHVTINDLPSTIHCTETEATQMTGGGFKERVHAFEKEIIMQAIKSAGGNRQKAANNLRVGLSTIYRKLESE